MLNESCLDKSDFFKIPSLTIVLNESGFEKVEFFKILSLTKLPHKPCAEKASSYDIQLLLNLFDEICFQYKVACMCFNSMNGSGLAYLSELLHVLTPSRTLHSSSDTRMLKI